MPQAATHIIIALVIGSFIRDYFIKKKKREKFPVHYILILGISTLLPDIDIAFYWVLYWFGFSYAEVHRPFTHNLFFPLIFLLAYLLTLRWKNKELGKHNLKIHTIFLIISLGIFLHLVLDVGLSGTIMPFYPFSNFAVGNNIENSLPYPLDEIFFPCLDALLLVLWLIYIEWKHRISDFI